MILRKNRYNKSYKSTSRRQTRKKRGGAINLDMNRLRELMIQYCQYNKNINPTEIEALTCEDNIGRNFHELVLNKQPDNITYYNALKMIRNENNADWIIENILIEKKNILTEFTNLRMKLFP